MLSVDSEPYRVAAIRKLRPRTDFGFARLHGNVVRLDWFGDATEKPAAPIIEQMLTAEE